MKTHWQVQTQTHTHTRTITHWCWQSAIFEDWVSLPPRVFNWMSVRLAIISETTGKKKNALKDSCYLWCQVLRSVSNWRHWFERWKMFLFVKGVYLLPNRKRISYFPNQKRFIICYYSVYIQKYCIRKEHKILVNPHNYAVLVIVNPRSVNQSSKLFTLSRQVTWFMTSTYVALEEYLMLRTCTEKQAWTESFGRVGSDKEVNIS